MNFEHDHEEYLINDLAQRAGVTVRTIRYYTDQGLLPPPDTRGKYATYNRGHLLRLELIREMKDAFLPLREIRNVITLLSDEEVRNRLNETRRTMPPKAMQVSDSKSNALDYIARVRDMQNELRPMDKDELTIQPAQSPPARRPQIPMGKIVDLNDNRQAERWRHIEIAPGVELHLREPIDPAIDLIIENLINEIRRHIRKDKQGG
jgi:DNA-binding transcriptional MerR regulator